MDNWTIFGLIGQCLFGARFLIQWIISEIKKRSHVPTVFWYLSITGGAVLLAYSIHKKDIVFIIGQGLGLFIYARNLFLIKKHGHGSPGAEETKEAY